MYQNELFFVLSLLAAFGLAVGIYLVVTHQRRSLTARFHALSNDVWQVEASLRTRDWEAEELDQLRASKAWQASELREELADLADDCIEHRDVALAGLLLGRMGYSIVKERCNLGFAAVAEFSRKLRDYDAKTAY